MQFTQIEPHYFDKENGIALIQGDCIEVLPKLLDDFRGKISCVLSDPPYGIAYVSNYRTDKDLLGQVIENDEDLDVIERAVPFLDELLAMNSALYFFAHPNMVGENRAIFDKIWTYKNLLVWDKGDAGTFGDLEAGYSLNYESVFYYNKGRRKLNGSRPRTILRWDGSTTGRPTRDIEADEYLTVIEKLIRAVPQELHEEVLTSLPQDIVRHALFKHPKAQIRKDWSSRNDPVHPTVKPIPLLIQLLKNSTNEGDIVIDPFMGCYDDKTEVLTNEGWKFFDNLNGTELFLTRNQEHVLSYETATEHQKYWYDGTMKQIKTRSIDLLVTPNHNMWVWTHTDTCADRTPQFIQAQDLTQKQYLVPSGGSIYEAPSLFTDDFMSLLGYYISEGYADHNRLIICQNSGEKQDKMLSTLKDYNWRMRNERKISVMVTSELVQFVKDNCGQKTRNKFISRLLLEQGNIGKLFEGMMLGDGHTDKTGTMTYYTCSSQLADDVQDLVSRLGYDSTIRIRQPRGGVIRSRKIHPENCLPQYEIRLRGRTKRQIKPEKHITDVNYSGYVYCVTVPNHTLYVRRNGSTGWCGNSGTCAAACKALGRRFIGIELRPPFFTVAVNRVNKTTLFDSHKRGHTEKPVQQMMWSLEDLK